MWKSLATIAVATLSIGCYQADHSVVYVDPSFSSEEEALIQKGADMWDQATSGAIHVNLVFGESLEGHNDFIKKSLNGGCGGVNSGPNIFMDVETCGTVLTLLAAHELGHRINGNSIHSEDTNSVMYPTLGACITSADIENACQKHDCTGYVMHPCD
jgi:hypothetical protein